MKNLIYTFRTELSDKAGFFVNVIASALVLFFVMLYFGSFYGTLKKRFETMHYNISVVSASLTYDNIKRLNALNLKGFLYCRMHCKERYVPGFSNNKQYDSLFANLCVFIGFPKEIFNQEGTPIKDNENLNYIYIADDLKGILGDIGDETVLGINKAEGIVSFFDKNDEADDGFELFKLSIDGTLGMAAGPSTVIVSPAFFFEHLTPHEMNIYLDSAVLTEDEYNADIKEISEIFGDVQPSDFDSVYGAFLESRRIQALILFVFGMISLLFLYSYSLSKKIKRFSVIRMCGATKGSVIFIIVARSLFTFILSFLLAAILGKLLNLILFEPVFELNAFDLSAADFILFFLFTLIIYSAASLIYILKFVKNSAVNIYRRSE